MSKQEQPQYDLNEKFYIFDNFITSNKQILERGDDDWDSSKIFFQLSIEHADNSPLTHEAEKYKNVDWSYLVDDNRVEKFVVSPRTHLFEVGNRNYFIYKYINVDDRYLIVVLYDTINKKSIFKVLYLDKFEYIEVYSYSSFLKAGNSVVASSRYILFAYQDGMVSLFDKQNIQVIYEKKLLAESETHEEEILLDKDMLVFKKDDNGKLLADIYDIKSEEQKSLYGDEADKYIKSVRVKEDKKESVSKYLYEYDDSLKSKDRTIKVIDKLSAKTLGILSGHNREGLRVIEISENKILTIARDSTIKIWDLNNCSLVNSITVTDITNLIPYYDKKRNILICPFRMEFSAYDLNFRDINIDKTPQDTLNGEARYFTQDELAIANGKNLRIINKYDMSKNRLIDFDEFVRPLSPRQYIVSENNFFAIKTLDGEWIVKDFDTNETLYKYQGGVKTFLLAVLQKYIIIGDKKELQLVNVYDAKEIFKIELDFSINMMKLSDDIVVVSSNNGKLAFIEYKENRLKILSTIQTDTKGLMLNEYSQYISLDKEQNDLVVYKDTQMFFEHGISGWITNVLFYNEKVVTIKDKFIFIWDTQSVKLLKRIEFDVDISLNSHYLNTITVLNEKDELIIICLDTNETVDRFDIYSDKVLDYSNQLIGKEKKSNIFKENKIYIFVKTKTNIYLRDKKTKNIIYWYPVTLSSYNFKILEVNNKYMIFSDHNKIKYLRVELWK